MEDEEEPRAALPAVMTGTDLITHSINIISEAIPFRLRQPGYTRDQSLRLVRGMVVQLAAEICAMRVTIFADMDKNVIFWALLDASDRWR